MVIGLAGGASAEAQDNDTGRTDGPLVLKEQGMFYLSGDIVNTNAAAGPSLPLSFPRSGWHALAARRRDHMIDGGGAAERPLPVRLALDARASLIAGDHLAAAHGGGDLFRYRGERPAHAF
jgi:hypothetical protein